MSEDSLKQAVIVWTMLPTSAIPRLIQFAKDLFATVTSFKLSTKYPENKTALFRKVTERGLTEFPEKSMERFQEINKSGTYELFAFYGYIKANSKEEIQNTLTTLKNIESVIYIDEDPANPIFDT